MKCHFPNQVLKKEIPLGNAKNPFYNNFEMQQRRDISSDQFSLPSNLANVQATPPPPPPQPAPNNSAIQNSNYGPAQMLLKPNPNNAKNRFANTNAADAYYGSGYFGKQSNPSIDYYGKYEVEFAAHQQKGALPNQISAFNNQHSKADFVDTKPPTDFHHIKGEIHHGIKPEFVQQQHHKNIEFHHGKAPNFHLNHQNFYNHHAASHVANVDGAHQVPSMQYNANQYFPNEYGANNDLDAPAAYYEQKAASAQQSYYENIYNAGGNSAGEFHSVNNAAYATPSNGQLPGEHCDGFMYPQYFEGNHHDSSVPMQSSQAQAQAHNHIAHGHNPTHQNHHYNHGVGGPHYHGTQQHINGNQHISASPMDNSNSSSDFNFLSNIANDFAPEYYQLS